ncbi:MAG: ribonuclease III [Planctomycetes bacterium RIFCSPHIGHO2_02_FULL_38_41]|nr:MAG: ribonuclease III [Planctomycetes bacterium RIFCSPHIGHO2_02_FULL_38_41]OHB91886.1 MAG: ribonuclease III [Planctomycetes bacterium RIFCSPHIGHO2_12_39_6]OHB98577.1 MAG: ribonuclease III [Planctomycetes bacterium RIFCSPLOWO2_12_38_17]
MNLTNNNTTLKNINECEQTIGYSFRDKTLLEIALTHTSCRLENNFSNERLEFLGDAVLGMVISDYLYKYMPNNSEGELTRIKSVVVCQSTLAKVSQEAQLKDFIVLGKGINDRNFLPKSILANAFEAVIAAIYLDGGIEAAYNFTIKYLKKEINIVCNDQHEKNYKSMLQQYSQKEHNVTPNYRILKQIGPEHGKSFEVMVLIDGNEYGIGWGKSKKEAEQSAARETLKMLTPDLICEKH